MKLRRIMSLLLAVAMLLTLVACGSSAKEEAQPTDEQGENSTPEDENPYPNGQLRVGMECAYAPNNWQESEPSDTNVPIENVPGAYAEGYDVQFARIIADGLGKELVIVKLSWDGLIDALNQGQIDAIIAGMADTAERRESINFSDPYHESIYAIMVNQDSPYADATSIHDFAGASILGQKDTLLDTVIDQMDGVNHLTPVDSVPDMISRLAQGACDGLVVNLENTKNYLEANPNFKVIEFAEGDGFELGFVGACVGLRKADTDLMNDINAILATVDRETRDVMWETAVEGQPG